ncbi:MAG: T9SS type A sorting domain-containing protein [Bacteroidota bacterium]
MTCLCMLFFPFIFTNAQCGVDPVNGTITINTASQIVNSYYPGQGSPASGTSSLTVGSRNILGSSNVIAGGDLIMIVQMQGADINSANSDSYGNGISGGVSSGYLSTNLYAGYYEYNSVASVSGSTITLSYSLANNYYTQAFSSGSIRSYQVIRIPRYYNLTIGSSGSVTCPPWNGSTGGMVVLDAANVLTINGNILVNGLGFRGGGGINFSGATSGNSNGSGSLTNTDHRWNSPFTTAANLSGGAKGEGIAGTPVYVLTTGGTTTTVNTVEGYANGAMGRGAPANAGGGGTDGSPVGSSTENQFNSGGGGGGNAGAGGQGGSGWHGSAGDVNTYPTGGNGGAAFAERSVQRLIMGGGGGAGTANNSDASNQYMSSGGAGGGIIFLRAKSYAGSGTLNANGADALGVTGTGGNTDAAGGGGAGGTIIAVTRLNGGTGLSTITANARGGKGGNMETYYDHGPGGGGGGGMIISKGAFASTNVLAGVNGLTRSGSTTGPVNNAYGATAGSNGQVVTMTFAPVLQNTNNSASPCGVLPITLTSFSALLNGSSVVLNWQIDNAINFLEFEIEYSTNGSSYTTIGQVAFNSWQTAYQFSHSPVTAPVNYYRLKMVNTDGSSRYSNVLVVRTGIVTKGMTVYPQPARDQVTISLPATRHQTISLQLFNSSGEKVKENTMQLSNGNNLFILDNLQHLPAGIYMMRTMVDEAIISARILIGK